MPTGRSVPATSTPLVSIGIAVHDEAMHLAATLDSLLAQDYPNLELVISDNASTDGTEAVCREYAARDRRIRYHREAENRGARHNFNQVLALSSGDYFTWASGHDLRAPSCVRRCVEVLEERPDVVLCYPRTLMVGFDDDSLEEIDGDTLETTGLPTAARLHHVIRYLAKGNAMYGVARARAMASLGGIRSVRQSDLAFLSELSLHGAFHQLDDRLFLRRQNRPAESRADATARQFAMLEPGTTRKASRFPHMERAWVVQKAVWHSQGALPSKFQLATRAAFWIGVPAMKMFVRRRLPS